LNLHTVVVVVAVVVAVVVVAVEVAIAISVAVTVAAAVAVGVAAAVPSESGQWCWAKPNFATSGTRRCTERTATARPPQLLLARVRFCRRGSQAKGANPRAREGADSRTVSDLMECTQ
jgi:hypothetical protein